MRIIAAFIMFMVCGLSVSAQRDSVIVNDGWRKDHRIIIISRNNKRLKHIY